MGEHPFGFPLVIDPDHDGWTVALAGASLGPVEGLIGAAHFLMGASMAFGATGVVASQVTAFGWGGLPVALFAVPFAAVGTTFAAWPVRKLLRLFTRVTLRVSGRSVRVEHRVAGWLRARDDLPLAACRDADLTGPFWDQRLELAGLTLPVFAKSEDARELVRLLRASGDHAHRHPDAPVPMPDALKVLRGSVASTGER